MDGVNGVEMMYDSDPNAAKHALYTLKVGGGQNVFFDPHLKKWGSTNPLTPCFRDLWFYNIIMPNTT